MDTKDKLVEVIKLAKEGLKMKEIKKEADAGSLAAPKEAPASSSGDKSASFAKATPDTVAQDKTAQPALQEDSGELSKPIMAQPSNIASPTGKGTPDDVAQNSKPVLRQESADEDEDDQIAELEEKLGKMKEKRMKEQNAEDEDKIQLEKFKEEYQDDMTKVTEILEKLKEKVEDLEKKFGESADNSAMDGKEEPQPPMTESASLNKTFVESIGNKDLDDKSFTNAVRKIIG